MQLVLEDREEADRRAALESGIGMRLEALHLLVLHLLILVTTVLLEPHLA